MPVKFNQFNTGPLNMSDHLVGYTSATPGGERRWTVQQIADAVAGIQSKGAPIQVKQVIKRDVSTVAGTPNPGIWQDVPGLSCVIAARTLNPFFRIQAMVSCASNNGNHAPMFRLYRVNQATLTEGVVANAIGIKPSDRPLQQAITTSLNSSGGPAYNPASVYLDIIDDQLTANPGNLVLYKLQWYIWNSVTGYINTGYAADTNNAYDAKAVSTITLTELAS